MADIAGERPDPDALLKTLDDAAREAARGKLRVYFGASAGVGKTYAMLVAARAQAAQGVNVLAGIVETHGRRETASLLEGIAALPLKDVAYRGHVLKEFDLDGALAARPGLVLVDELAHSNAPGSRHAKRWQDIHELLAAGIDVWTTLNVQHLDSLNEAVGSITGVRVWETVPDEVFDTADEVILVDLSADELLRRLKEGKVYLPEQARHATRNFFRKGNLIALRELALRRTADHVDDDVQAYRRDRAIEPVWRTREAVVACIGSDADAEYIIRSAHRLSQQLECDLHVVTIDTPRAAPTPQAEQDRMQRSLALADSLGARTETLPGGDMVDAVVRYVRRHNITKAVVGRTRASGLQRLRVSLSALLSAALAPGWLWRRHSFADMLAAGCPEIDIIRLGAPSLPASAPPGRDPLTLGRGARINADDRGAGPWPGYAWALCYCAAATGLSMLAFPALHQTNIVMLFLLAVVAVALRHGRGPAALASVVSVGLFDFFFVQPLASFAVSDVQYLLTFAVLLAVGLLIGQLTAGLRLQAQVSVKREADARSLYEFARELSSALLPEQIVALAGAFVHATFGSRCALYILALDDRLKLASPAADMPALESALAQWVYDHGQPAGAGTTTLSNSELLYLPLKAPMRTRGVLALAAPRRSLFTHPDARRQIEAYATLIAIALERLHYVEVAQQALVSMESERLRNSLLAAVSHDLRTPLTSLVGMTDTLTRRPGSLPDDVQETIRAMRDQAQRMHALVVNLLDMARLQSHDTPLRLEWQSIEELVGASLAAMREPLAAHRVTVAPLSNLPLVECDGVLIERVLCNLLENAAKYTPPGSTVHIHAAVHDGMMRVAVCDNGPGVAPGTERRIFEKFTRGDRESATPGVGLGLAVCEAIIQAHHGRIWVEHAPGQASGAQFVFSLPLGTPPDVQPETQPDIP
ncbi:MULTISPECIES: sensor histidine kinase [Achromobacter]|uniref:histidine kinase n=1 Tax=Achromobacter spanius TaxID=217203 RepID=A0ABY8GSU7_9BURK|nr:MULTISPECIES: sensor histidine kinase KdpD [Achromobacter]WAI83116.1 sensor histidine kinase KdpD [Achromobacter spanius]WEX93200.1 sensor histidine kinase KdpD [Achromobacter sp. SS2-2022]WFP07643.1 sensor histidine kinase KdpD [Achromobacter spanius]